MDTDVRAPKVSIIVATYNRADFIAAAIDSALKQAYQDWELLVLDDGSTDDTENIVAAFSMKDGRIRFIRQEKNVGIARNRNRGLEESKGEYIAMLDSDDVWLDEKKLEKQVAFLEAHPECAVVGTNVAIIDKDGHRTGSFEFETKDKAIRAKMLRRNQFAQSSLLYRKSAALEAGMYDPTYAIADDYDLWLKIGKKGGFANLPDYTTGYRVHGAGITKEKKFKAANEHMAIIKKHRASYPHFALAAIKAYLRIVIAALSS